MESAAYQHTTEKRVDPPPIRPEMGYPKSVPGILKIVEIFLCILVLICSSIDYWYHHGAGWVNFVAASAMITTIILFVFHFCNIISRLPGPWTFIEFVYYAVMSLLWAIAAIVAAMKAPLSPAIGAAAFFTFVALAVYMVDAYFMYRAWKTNPGTGMQATAVTTTTTTYETRTQY